MPTTIYIKPRRGSPGRFEVREGAETALFCISSKPFHDAARILQRKGRTGTLEMWWEGASFPAMLGTIEDAALRTVSETDTQPPRFAKFKAYPE